MILDDTLWPLVNQKLNVLSKAGLTKENLAEASTIDKHNNVFKELIEESDSSTKDQNDMPSASDVAESNETNKSTKISSSPPAIPNAEPQNKQTINKQLSGDMKQLKIDQLMNFDLAQLEDSPPNKKIKF